MLNYGMGITISAIDKTTHVVRSIEGVIHGLERTTGKSLNFTGRDIQKFAGGIAVATAGMAGLTGSWNLAKQAALVERGLTSVNIVAHATAAELKELKKFALQTGVAMGFMPMDSIKGMEILAQQGMQVSDILKTLPEVMKFARANNMMPEIATDISTSLMTSFQLPQDYLTYVLAQAQKTADMYKMSIDDLEQGVARGTAGFNLSKAYVTDFLHVLGMIKNTVKSPMMAGTMASYLSKELVDLKNRTQIKAKLGIEVEDGKGGFRRPFEVLREMYEKTSKMSTVHVNDFLSKVFNETSRNALVAYFAAVGAGITDSNNVLHKGADAITYSMETIGGAIDTHITAFDQKMQDFQGSLDVATSTWQAFKDVVGEPFKEAWKPFLIAFTAALVAMKEAFSSMSPEMQKFIANFVVIGSMVGIFAGLGGILVKLWPVLRMIFAGLGEGMALFLIDALPIIAILAMLYGLYVVISDAVAACSGQLGGLSAAFENMASTVGKAFSAMGEGFTEAFHWVMQLPIIQASFAMIRASVGILIDALTELWNSFSFGENASTIFKGIGSAIGWFVGVIVAAITIFINVLLSTIIMIVTFVVKIVTVVVGFFELVFDAIGKFVAWVTKAWGIVKWIFGAQKAAPDAPKKNQIEEAWTGPNHEPPNNGSNQSEQPVKQTSSNAKDFIPLSRMTIQNDKASGYYEGVVPAGGDTKDPIDYDKLAAACAKTPMYCVFDGNKIVGYIKKANDEQASLRNE